MKLKYHSLYSLCVFIVVVQIFSNQTRGFSLTKSYNNPDFDYNDNYNLDVNRNYSNRESRFFPFFTIIRFANSECGGPNSFNGTCFTRRECNDIGGSYSGTCASRRGVCCIVQKSCGSTTNVNNTYFTNSEFPATFGGGRRCSILVQRCNSGVCQLRLDLLEFSMAQPNGDGVCETDGLVITGGTSVPRICGDNSGQHLYVDFIGDGLITISIDANSGFTFNRRWNIKLTQIACNCPTIAPTGCLQYYTGSSGTVSSFNFGTAANTALTNAGLTGTREIVNLNYGVCVRVEQGFCSIQWSQSGVPFSFTMIGDVDTGGVATTTCNTDYIIIPSNVEVVDRYCVLPTFNSITTSTKPFVLYVVTDGNEGTDSGNRGFQLNFAQQACTP